MKEIKFLSSSNYADSETINYGDCILINTGSELIIYDCGSEEHADRVIDYMTCNGFDKAKFILSHNDSDHFDGLPKLLQEENIEAPIFYDESLEGAKQHNEMLRAKYHGRV